MPLRVSNFEKIHGWLSTWLGVPSSPYLLGLGMSQWCCWKRFSSPEQANETKQTSEIRMRGVLQHLHVWTRGISIIKTQQLCTVCVRLGVVGAFSLSQDANCPIVAFIKVVAGDANRPSNKITGMGMMMAMMVPGGYRRSEVVTFSRIHRA